MKKLTSIFVLFVLLLPVFVQAAMTSTSYSIIFDAIGVTGGEISTSTSYTISDTVSENFAQVATSTTYTVKGGFQSADFGSLVFTLSSGSLNLGTLSASTVNSASVNATVSSDTGYSLSVLNVSGTMPAAVSGGAVVAGTEGYGFTASGANSVIVGDVAVAPGVVISNTLSQAINDITALTFKAAMSATSTAGSYSQSIDLVATAH